MRTKLWIMVLTVMLFVGATTAVATNEDPCDGSFVTGIQVPSGDSYYVDVRSNDNGIWTYREANGIEGLQRGSESVLVDHMVEDPCVDDLTEYGPEAVPDELIL